MGIEPDRQTIGRPLIIPVFIPHQGCTHHCIFCNQGGITGQALRTPSAEQIHQEVYRYLHYGRRPRSTTQISFFGGNFLGLTPDAIQSLLETAMRFVRAEQVDSIRFSTRPDTVKEETLNRLKGYPISTVEIGVQSMNDRVLELADRGHRSADTLTAAHQIKARGYQLGLQMMVGLPGDDDHGAMQTARQLAAVKPDFVRIYPTLVLAGSRLADWLSSGRYHPLPLTDCVSLVKRLFLYFTSQDIPVVRMGLQASDELAAPDNLLAGPYHPAFGHLVHADIVLDKISAALAGKPHDSDQLTISVHPSRVSRVQGLRKSNLSHLKQAFGLKTITLIQDAGLHRQHLEVEGQRVVLP
jgi:histone acetyltransferase (RNA polymerase elongator complex component)